MNPRVDRILFLGLDGGTQTVLQPMFDRGVMPNLRGLWERSSHGSLVSTLPMVTPVAWTSFLTGCEPGLHGIHEFFHLDSERRCFQANTAKNIRVDTLWNILGAHGRSVVSINLPMTYPAPAVDGLIISGNDAPGHRAAISSCLSFAAKLAAAEPGFTTRNLWKTRPATPEELDTTCRKTEAQFKSLARAAIMADSEVNWTALMVQFQNLDGLLHRAWPELNVDGGPAPSPAGTRSVERTLRTLDEACARLIDLADQRGAAIVALSDHGFGPCKSVINVNGLLQAGGYQRRLSYGTRFRYRFHRLSDRWRRYQLGRQGTENPPVSRTIAGEVGCDWKRTVAFAPFGQLSACVYLNQDQVHTTARADSLRAEIAEYLQGARHPETGERLFVEAFDMAQKYGCNPAEQGNPDILAGSVDGIQAQAKWDPRSSALSGVDRSLPGTHYRQGIIAIQAPGMTSGPVLTGRLADVAPTALTFLGIDVPGFMQGRPLRPGPAGEGMNTAAFSPTRPKSLRFDPFPGEPPTPIFSRPELRERWVAVPKDPGTSS